MHQEIGADRRPTEGRPGGYEEPPAVRGGRGGLDLIGALLTLGLGLAIPYFAVALVGRS